MGTSVREAVTSYPARYFAAWNGRDLEVVAGLLASRFSWVDPSLPAEITDLEGAHGFFQAGWQGFPDLRFDLVGDPLVDEATGRVAQEWRMIGTHTGEGFPPGVPPTGRAFDLPGTDVFTVDAEGRATAIHAYWDVTTLAHQLGLA
ncbi:ester cyclase [Candidatus Protofrankia californiensis]|uniref:ester cyclase n=1 Tax=Candidatus Protofrankia californiensis TaxID=1839754 RepID=UPI001041ADF5|nr:nuclear transport factor 2 family protein [Candidatus Protofrankia californiensis]